MAAARRTWALARDAAVDAVARRLSVGIAGVALLGVMTAESCTAFGADSFQVNGTPVPPEQVAGWIAPFLYGYQVVLVWVLAGLLAADHLARPVREGVAQLWLARPVGRGAYALARLGGALAVTLAVAAVLLGATGALLVGRHGLDVGPAAAGALAAVLGAVMLAAAAMTASLVMARVAVVALVVMLVPAGVGLGALALLGTEVGGLAGAAIRHGPPLGAALAASVAPWHPWISDPPAWGPVLGRLALWAAVWVGALLALFRRLELPR